MTEKGRPPGLLRASVDPDVVMMVCTAGHVDHGKTRLVKLLTGCNTDRLKQEQDRGLTIDLGFAPCFLGGNLCVGIVDVPGHEKFVKNMVAGVSGIDMTILVIAADDGIMPQTIEHFQIMDLLGVRHGIVALTKTDLVPEERVEEVKEDIEILLAGTFMEGAPICPVSSETGDGFFEFYEVLVGRIKQLEKQRRLGVFRMPVERTFVQKGFGLVVTGIPVAGHIEVGSEVEVSPGGLRGRIRGIQRFLRDATEGGFGQCLALNVPDFTKAPPERGCVLCMPGYLQAASCFHVKVTAVPDVGLPVRNAEQVKLHTGTSEVPGKLYLLEQKKLEKNQTGLATILTSEPVPAVPGDRFILRRPSPARTVAGGEILDATHSGRRPRRKALVERLTDRLRFLDGIDVTTDEGVDKRIDHQLRTERYHGASTRELSVDLHLPIEIVQASLERLEHAGRVLSLGADLVIHADSYARCLAEVEHRLQEAVERGGALSLSLPELRKGLAWPPALWNRIQDDLVKSGKVAVRGNKLVLRTAVADMSPADRRLMDRVIDAYDRSGFNSPRPEELPEILGAPAASLTKLLGLLYDDGTLIRLSKNVVLSYNHLKQAQDLVVQTIQEKGSLDSADFKQAIGSTRKYALAILDYFDSRRVTMRNDNIRKLSPDYERNLL